MSFPRGREPRIRPLNHVVIWFPACAGMTVSASQAVTSRSNQISLRHERLVREIVHAGGEALIPKVMSRDEVRNVDQRAIDEFGIPGVVLMENAGRGCVDWLEELGITGRVVICAGKGNNGGDGFVIARHLENRGHDVRVLLFADPDSLRGDAEINYQVIKLAQTPIRVFAEPTAEQDTEAEFMTPVKEELSSATWIVDALLGTGTKGSLREPFPAIIDAINQSSARTFAVDLPSGQDCDTGLPVDADHPVAVKASFTATFVARKVGFEHPSSSAFTGEIRVIDIGVPHAMFSDNPTQSRSGTSSK